MDGEDDDIGLNITPSFKSRSSKGKGRATPRSSEGNPSQATSRTNDDEDDQAGDSSAILFKKSASKKNRVKSLLGGASASSSSSSAPRSRLSNNVSFGGGNDDEENEDNASRASSVAAAMDVDGDESMNDGDVSVSEVRKLNMRKKNRRLGGIGSSSLNKAAEK